MLLTRKGPLEAMAVIDPCHYMDAPECNDKPLLPVRGVYMGIRFTTARKPLKVVAQKWQQSKKFMIFYS